MEKPSLFQKRIKQEKIVLTPTALTPSESNGDSTGAVPAAVLQPKLEAMSAPNSPLKLKLKFVSTPASSSVSVPAPRPTLESPRKSDASDETVSIHENTNGCIQRAQIAASESASRPWISFRLDVAGVDSDDEESRPLSRNHLQTPARTPAEDESQDKVEQELNLLLEPPDPPEDGQSDESSLELTALDKLLGSDAPARSSKRRPKRKRMEPLTIKLDLSSPDKQTRDIDDGGDDILQLRPFPKRQRNTAPLDDDLSEEYNDNDDGNDEEGGLSDMEMDVDIDGDDLDDFMDSSVGPFVVG